MSDAAKSAAAKHLAELDARYDGHLAALQRRAQAAKEKLADAVVTLAPAPPPRPSPAFDDPLLEPGAPAAAAVSDEPSGTVDEDGIPIWQDP